LERPDRVAPSHVLKQQSALRFRSRHDGASPEDIARRKSQLYGIGCCAALVAVTFLQKPGKIAPDSKLDLTQDPVQFLERALQLWDPQSAFGQLQNQAYGYLFPVGPFFAAAHGLGIPGWIVQRSWQSLLLIVAFQGLRTLARRFGIGTPGSQVLGSLAYAFSPLILGRLGSVSVEALPACMAPWVLVPLVGADALARPRRAAALSGVAILCAGGVNATATLAVLVLPGLWLLMGGVGVAQRRLAGWWMIAVVLATAWWALPLVELGRYSPPFLAWIESAPTTTATTGALAVLSGTSDWLAYFSTPYGPGFPGPYSLVSQPVAILAVAAVAALGMCGLLARRLRGRRFLLGGVLLGVALVSFGHVGAGTSPFALSERSLLDGSLAAFRNVDKFDPVLRIPLALGVAHAAATTWRRRRHPSYLSAAPVLGVVSVAALAGASLPILLGRVEPPGSFTALPAYWVQTADWLAAHTSRSGRALLLPATQHPIYTWGLPTDEPLQVLASSPWAVRDLPPLGGAGEALLLDTVSSVVASGHGNPGLALYLARAGVEWLVVRNDVNGAAERGMIPSPVVIEAALEGSPGISVAATFGPDVGETSDGPSVENSRIGVTLPAVQVYQVSGNFGDAALEPVAGTLRVSGAPASLLELADAGMLPGGTATVMTADPPVPGVQEDSLLPVSTDGYRRQETNMGVSDYNQSATLTPDQPWSADREAHDFVIGDPTGHQTVAVTIGAEDVRASSSAGGILAAHGFDPTATPPAAFDSDPKTAWESGARTAVGQWVEVDFSSPRSVSSISIEVPDRAGEGPPVTGVNITTAIAKTALRLDGRQAQTFALPPGVTRFVRVTVTAVQGGGAGRAAVLKMGLAGIPSEQPALEIPDDEDNSSAQPAFVFAAENGGNAGCVALTNPVSGVCSPALTQNTEDRDGLDRVFTVTTASRFRLTVSAVAQSGGALAPYLPTAGGVHIRASSQLVEDPADSAETLLEGGLPTGWIASPADPDPALTITLPASRTVTGLRLTRLDNLPASTPRQIKLTSGSVSVVAPVGASGQVILPRAVTGQVFRLSFPEVDARTSVGRAATTTLPVGLTQLRLIAAGLDQQSPAANSSFTIPCGQGPAVELDGVSIPTDVNGTLANALADGPLSVTTCGPYGGSVSLAAGTHTLLLPQNALVTPDETTLVPLGDNPPQIAGSLVTSSRPMTIVRWHSDSRAVRVGAGAASWLVVPENANAGWVATLSGHHLTAAVVDGWQQAFVVPAGAGGLVTLRYAPDRVFRDGLLVGAVAALGLVPMALLRSRRRRSPVGTPGWGAMGRTIGMGTALVAVPLIGGAVGAGAVLAVGSAAYGVWRLSGRSREMVRRALSVVAVGGLMAAGALAALRPVGIPMPATSLIGAQTLALVGLAALVGGLVICQD